jgi:hypothetical protein
VRGHRPPKCIDRHLLLATKRVGRDAHFISLLNGFMPKSSRFSITRRATVRFLEFVSQIRVEQQQGMPLAAMRSRLVMRPRAAIGLTRKLPRLQISHIELAGVRASRSCSSTSFQDIIELACRGATFSTAG